MAKSDSKTVNPEKSSQASDRKIDEGKIKALGLASPSNLATGQL